MLNSLKNTLRFFKKRWMKLKLRTRFFLFAALIGLIFGGHNLITRYEPMQTEENYSAMEEVVYTMAEIQSIDVAFDTSNISKYTVVHKGNGEYEITITGARLENMYATLTEDYQIKTLERNGRFILFVFWLFCFAMFICQGYVITAVLYVSYRFVRKIILFLEE